MFIRMRRERDGRGEEFSGYPVARELRALLVRIPISQQRARTDHPLETDVSRLSVFSLPHDDAFAR